MTVKVKSELLDKVARYPDWNEEPSFVLWDGRVCLDDGYGLDPVEVKPRLVCPHCDTLGLLSVDRLSSDPPLPGKKNRRSRYYCHHCMKTTNKKIWSPTPADYGDNLEIYEVDYTVSAHDFED